MPCHTCWRTHALPIAGSPQEDLAAVMPHLAVSEDEDSTPAWKADGSRALSAVATKLRGTAEQLVTQASASATEADVDAYAARSVVSPACQL